jgi:hypothetical protein
MATHKANRSIHLTQPQPESAKLMPVRAHTYRSLAEMNAGLEQAIQGLETLKRINFLSSNSLTGIHHLLSQLWAQANRELMAILTERETANAHHFQQLCREPVKPLIET